MALRLMVLAIVLAVSLSGCGPALLGSSTPIAVEPGLDKTKSIPDVDLQPSGTRSSPDIVGDHGRGPRGAQSRALSEKQHGLMPGSAAYQIPLSMVENQSSPVDLWIDASISVEDLMVQLNSFLIENANSAAVRLGQSVVKSKAMGTTQITGRDVLIGRKMYAELIGQDFEIQPSGIQEQTYIEGRSLRWSWWVKPKRAGKEGLPLEIKVMADPGEGKTPVETIREVVIVQARKQSLREIFEAIDWWIKLLGGGGVSVVAVGLVKWLLPRRRAKKKEAEG